jgi:hypothetical protein
MISIHAHVRSLNSSIAPFHAASAATIGFGLLPAHLANTAHPALHSSSA